MRMTSAIWLNAAAIVVVAGIWTFAVAHAHRVLARDERRSAAAPLTAQRATGRVRGAASEGTGSPVHLAPAGSARGRQQAGRQRSPAELVR